MRYIYLYYELNLSSPLQVGSVELWSRVSLQKYTNKALLVPGYGWVPCSKALCDNFTNDPKHLVLVLSEEDDPNKPVTSDIWVARTGLLRALGVEKHQEMRQNTEDRTKDVKLSPNVKVYNRMSARALVISENAVLQFLESPKKDKNGTIVQEISFVCGTKKGYVSPAARSILKTGTIDDFQYIEVSLDGKKPIPCILKTTRIQ
jgi:hypothetical protein